MKCLLKLLVGKFSCLFQLCVKISGHSLVGENVMLESLFSVKEALVITWRNFPSLKKIYVLVWFTSHTKSRYLRSFLDLFSIEYLLTNLHICQTI